VQKGKHLSKLPQKYQVTPYDIYQLNPDAQSGLKPNILLIQNNNFKTTNSNQKPNSEKSTLGSYIELGAKDV
jgi:LysM repeat protein